MNHTSRRPMPYALVWILLSLALSLTSRASEEPEAPPQEVPVHVEFFVMSRCPFAAEAVRAVLPWKEVLGENMWLRVYFIAREAGEPRETEWEGWEIPQPGSATETGVCKDEASPFSSSGGPRFTSLHGPAEVEEDLRQYVLQTYFPEIFPQYLRRYYEGFPDADWREICESLGLDPGAVELLRTHRDIADEFAQNLQRARELGIHASPTLLINGELFFSPVTRWSLGRLFCRRGIAQDSVCGEVPVCGSDLDCSRDGFIGECRYPESASAECVFTKAVETKLTILRPDDCAVCDASPVISVLTEFLPLLQPHDVFAASDEGRALAQELDLRYAPAYLLPGEVNNFPRFDTFRSLFLSLPGHYMVNPEWLSVVVLLGRDSISGRIDLIGGSLSPQAARIRHWFRENLPDSVVNERLYLPRNPKGGEEILVLQPGEGEVWTLEPARLPKFSSPRGGIEIEENLFQISLAHTSREDFRTYRKCADDKILHGIEPASCRTAIETSTAEFAVSPAHAEEFQTSETEWVESLGLTIGPFALLIDNRILLRDFDKAIRDWLLQRFKPPSAPFHKGG